MEKSYHEEKSNVDRNKIRGEQRESNGRERERERERVIEREQK